ncbi:hypothetical protein Nepgr_032991 [Nepenthes gracilis]|uniref:Uncharacterized protein n=1 Tax=Nepenthes gracilis TaxID=150966 RepID=A0AAD3TLH7_NEPGR|nr:hypothetical protein Nepgr_032991 [Nepenthes gracilis]
MFPFHHFLITGPAANQSIDLPQIKLLFDLRRLSDLIRSVDRRNGAGGEEQRGGLGDAVPMDGSDCDNGGDAEFACGGYDNKGGKELDDGDGNNAGDDGI